MGHRLYKILILPHALQADARRREFVLNSLLAGLLAIATPLVLLNIVNFFIFDTITSVQNVYEVIFFETLIVALIIISRRGKPLIAALLFQSLLLLSSLLFVMSWGYRLPEAQLMFALMVVIAGVLFSARLAFAAAAAAVLGLWVVASYQILGIQHPHTTWQQLPLGYIDLIGGSGIFIVMGIVAWLSNRETDRSLARARRSEAALITERDNLEQKVLERTRELEDLQVARLLEIQPFAEFGRIGANLVHEITNPLTAATLQLEELNRQQQSQLVRQAQQSLQELEKYLLAARKQIKRESDLRSFAVGKEVSQIVRLLQHRARRASVAIKVENSAGLRLYGDVVKFDQLIANLLANAIDASEGISAVVTVRVSAARSGVQIDVIDNGVGISAEQLPKLFEPLYSTKDTKRSGLGIGLALVKQYVQKDFKGTIKVSSSKAKGTCFSLILKGQKQ